MFSGNCGAHRDRAQEVTQATQTKDDEKAKADAEQRVEKRLNTDAIDYVNEQAETEQEGECLEPNQGSSRVVVVVSGSSESSSSASPAAQLFANSSLESIKAMHSLSLRPSAYLCVLCVRSDSLAQRTQRNAESV